MKVFFFSVFMLLVLSGQAQPITASDSTQPNFTTQTLSIKTGLYKLPMEKYAHYFNDDICANLTPDFSKEQIDRVVVDLLILCLAFESQNVALKLSISPLPNNRQGIAQVEAGKFDILPIALWTKDINTQHVYSSADVIRSGEHEKGIYLYEKHPLFKAEIPIINLDNYVGISMKSWVHDWEIINHLSPRFVTITHLPNLFLMLKAGRADFTLYDFSTNAEHKVQEKGITLKPLPGMKVVIYDSRRFVVSKKYPQAKFYMTTLNEGIKALRKTGKISELYQLSGFKNNLVKNWQVIN